MDCVLQAPVHGTSQARILEWVAISFSRGPSQPRDQTCILALAGRYFTADPPFFGLIIVLTFYGGFDDRIMYA